MNVLLVDDCEDTGLLVVSGLGHYVIRQAHSIASAKAALQEDSYSLILIDVNLPDGSGFEFCMGLSRDAQFRDLPKILLTAKGETSEKVYGFNCGADDYVTKPFHTLELRARVDRYLLRRSSDQGRIYLSGFEFSPEHQKCWALEGSEKRDLALTPTEFRLFFNLVKNEGRVLTRKALEKAAWESFGTVIEARGIDTHIAHLRKKLGLYRTSIVSIYGQGYTFQSSKVSQAA